jgi:hypothetical protein
LLKDDFERGAGASKEGQEKGNGDVDDEDDVVASWF